MHLVKPDLDCQDGPDEVTEEKKEIQMALDSKPQKSFSTGEEIVTLLDVVTVKVYSTKDHKTKNVSMKKLQENTPRYELLCAIIGKLELECDGIVAAAQAKEDKESEAKPDIDPNTGMKYIDLQRVETGL